MVSFEHRIKKFKERIKPQINKELHVFLTVMEYPNKSDNIKAFHSAKNFHTSRVPDSELTKNIETQRLITGHAIGRQATHVRIFVIPAKYLQNEINEEILAKHTIHEELIPFDED